VDIGRFDSCEITGMLSSSHLQGPWSIDKEGSTTDEKGVNPDAHTPLIGVAFEEDDYH
jgi:hypothetical protein